MDGLKKKKHRTNKPNKEKNENTQSWMWLCRPFPFQLSSIFLVSQPLIQTPLWCENKDSVTLWTVACQAPLSTEFSRQDYWSRLPLPSLKIHIFIFNMLAWAAFYACYLRGRYTGTITWLSHPMYYRACLCHSPVTRETSLSWTSLGPSGSDHD